MRGLINQIRITHPSHDVSLLLFSYKYHPNLNDFMLSCLNYYLGFVCYWSQACFCHVIHSLVLRVDLYFIEGYIYIYIMYVYYYPFSGTSILLVFIIDILLMGKNSISDTSVMKFAYFSTAWSSIPSKPINNK